MLFSDKRPAACYLAGMPKPKLYAEALRELVRVSAELDRILNLMERYKNKEPDAVQAVKAEQMRHPRASLRKYKKDLRKQALYTISYFHEVCYQCQVSCPYCDSPKDFLFSIAGSPHAKKRREFFLETADRCEKEETVLRIY